VDQILFRYTDRLHEIKSIDRVPSLFKETIGIGLWYKARRAIFWITEIRKEEVIQTNDRAAALALMRMNL
jgi:hypothetical protein